MGYDVGSLFALFSHELGSPLIHTYPVAPAGAGEHDIIALCLDLADLS